MFFFKCDNAVLRVEDGRKYIKCKKLNDTCVCQRYCPQKRNYELTPMSQNCKLNPKNIKETNIDTVKKIEKIEQYEEKHIVYKLPKQEKMTSTPLKLEENEQINIEKLEDLGDE